MEGSKLRPAASAAYLNLAVEPTCNSLRSCLAAAIARGSCPALIITHNSSLHGFRDGERFQRALEFHVASPYSLYPRFPIALTGQKPTELRQHASDSSQGRRVFRGALRRLQQGNRVPFLLAENLCTRHLGMFSGCLRDMMHAPGDDEVYGEAFLQPRRGLSAQVFDPTSLLQGTEI